MRAADSATLRARSGLGLAVSHVPCMASSDIKQPGRPEELAGDLGRVALQAVDLVVELPHRGGVDLAGEAFDRLAKLGMAISRSRLADERDGLVGREIAAVVFELTTSPSDSTRPSVESPAATSSDFCSHGLIEQVPVHLAGPDREVQPISLDQSRVAVGPVHELGAEPGAEGPRRGGRGPRSCGFPAIRPARDASGSRRCSRIRAAGGLRSRPSPASRRPSGGLPPGSFSGGCLRIAVRAVPVYST